MRRRTKQIILIITLLVTAFITSYYLNNIYKLYNNSNNVEANVVPKEKGLLEDKMKISLSKGNVNEENKTLIDLKKELGIEGDVTEDILTNALSQKGYILTQASSSIMYYSRSVVPNKYYIMQYKESLAIYKSDQNCKLFIEKQDEDIYQDGKKYSHFTEIDRQKMENYEMEYDTKAAAEEAISELIS